MVAETGRPPSMVDVALRAGVAHVTVSRVLNDPDAVRPQTRARVERAIAELGYQRNDVARALKRGRSSMLGIILAGSELFELPRVLLGMEEAASEAGHGVSIASWQKGGSDALRGTVDRLVAQGAAGIVIIADRPVALSALEHLRVRVPTSVVMSGDVRNTSIGSVEIDQMRGARMATEHLIGLGHRDIVHISGRLQVFDARARAEGWRAVMAEAGVAAPEILEGDFTGRAGYEWAGRIADRATLPTAVFAGNDQIAMGVLAAFVAGGVSVPGDVSVVGFDDLPGAEFLVPALTTVRQDFVRLGRRSIEELFDMVGGTPARHHLIAPTLVVRQSTAPPDQRRATVAPVRDLSTPSR
jgi:DNA-binding LacI/PurR family transcriptional regulator